MPAQPVWYHRLHDIRTELEELQESYLDRLAVQKLFDVRERRARQIMSGLPCIQVGNAIAVERLAVIRFLESVAAGERFERETARRARLIEKLDSTRRDLSARRVSIPAPPLQDRAMQFGDGIELRPGELRITFSGAEDLAAKLFALSQSMVADWVAFQRAADATP